MIELPTTPGGWPVICADPATDFAAGKKGRPQHYPRMTDHEIASLPVADIAAKDAILLVWVTSPKLYRSPGSRKNLTPQEIAAKWGFRFSGRAFIWVKTHLVMGRSADPLFIHRNSLHMGQGFTTRKNAEDVLLFKRGKPKRLSGSVHEIIISPRREHSRKPQDFYDRVEQYADGPYLDLFSRVERPGWTVWGNETTKFNEG